MTNDTTNRPEGDLISRPAAIAYHEVRQSECKAEAEAYRADGLEEAASDALSEGLVHGEAIKALRALPAATDAGEVEAELRRALAQIESLDAECDRRHARIAELEAEHEAEDHRRCRQIGDAVARAEKAEAERDATLALVAVAYEAAAQNAEDNCEPGMYRGASDDFRSGYEDAGGHIAKEIRALTPADAKASLDRLIADAVKAALATQIGGAA